MYKITIAPSSFSLVRFMLLPGALLGPLGCGSGALPADPQPVPQPRQVDQSLVGTWRIHVTRDAYGNLADDYITYRFNAGGSFAFQGPADAGGRTWNGMFSTSGGVLTLDGVDPQGSHYRSQAPYYAGTGQLGLPAYQTGAPHQGVVGSWTEAATWQVLSGDGSLVDDGQDMSRHLELHADGTLTWQDSSGLITGTYAPLSNPSMGDAPADSYRLSLAGGATHDIYLLAEQAMADLVYERQP